MVVLLIITIIPLSIYIYFLDFSNIELNDDERATLTSLTKLDDYPLYYMEYYGDYGFEEYLRVGEKIQTSKNLPYAYACTCFCTLTDNTDNLFGRNFDWSKHPSLLLYTNPPEGHKSISMVDLEFIGYDSEDQIADRSIEDIRGLLSAPYIPLDGMNEYGLTIACMAIPEAENTIENGKVTIGSLAFMRLALDYAKNIEEAIELWNNYNVYFPPGPDLHYLVADAEGNSAIIEWIDGEMVVIQNENTWQVSTNFVVYGTSELEKNQCRRYKACQELLSEKEGKVTSFQAMELLKTASQVSTQWSIVYNMHSGQIDIVMGRDYENSLTLDSFDLID